MVPVAVRLSIEFRDDEAVDLVWHLVERDDLEPHHPAVLGLILWIAGNRDEAVPVSALPPAEEDDFGWYTQAAISLNRFIRASNSDPATVIELLAAGEGTEQPGRPIATVGAMVGRLALMRMRAYLALEQWDLAVLEARTVLEHHGYRRYELHAQPPDREFEVALVSRLAVTPDELLEARATAERESP